MKPTIRIALTGLACGLALLLPLVPVQAAPAAADIARGPAGQPGQVRTDGTFVAWSEVTQPSRFSRFAQLYVAPLGGSPTQLGGDLNYSDYAGPLAPGFDLDSGTLVWVDSPASAAPALRARNLRSGETITVSDERAAMPAIAGDNVVWWAGLGWGGAQDGPPAKLMLRNLSTLADPVALAEIGPTRDYLIGGVRLSARWVVWLQGAYTNGESSPPCWDIYTLPLSGGTPRRVDSLGCDSTYAINSPDLAGDTLAYTNQAGQLVLLNLASGASSTSGPQHNRGNTFDGRFAFWIGQFDPSVWGYDPRSDSAFVIDRLVRTDAAPHAGGGVLAWFSDGQANVWSVRTRPIAELLPAAPRAANDPLLGGRGFFPETGHSLGGAFQAYWNHNGGLPVFGYALTEEFIQKAPGATQAYGVQYFERQRFEYHPEHAGTPYEVLLGRLGAEALGAQGRDWQALPKANPAAPHYFAATGQAIAPEFWEYWRTHGLEFGDAGVSERESLALWGYPIGPAAYEPLPNGETLLVQWFERARFELHPNNPAPYKVLLGRLAADRVDAFGWR